MKKLAPILVLLLAVATLAGRTADGEAPAFSRSRWILEQQAWGARFSGGVMPADPARVRAILDSLKTSPPVRAAAPRHTRVSGDILEPDGGAGQPETQAEPYIAIDPERETHLLAAYQEGRFATGGARALTYAVSFNGGRTWTEGLVPGLTTASGGPFDRASDPWAAFGPGGRAYYVTLAFDEGDNPNGIFVSSSADGGLTWGPPVPVRTETTDFGDKEAMTVDTRADSPYRGRVYVAWDTVLTASRNQVLRVSWSADGGASFMPAVTVLSNGINIGALPVVGPGGAVHLFWIHADQTGDFIVVSRSDDGGDHWTSPVIVSDLRAAGVPDHRTGGGLPSAAVDPRNGDLYAVWQDDRFSPGTDQVVLTRSRDGGETWTEPKRVSDGPLNAANFTPAVAVNANGAVGVAYYSLRNDPGRRFLVDEYLTTSKDRGRRFGKGVRVSSASWDTRFAALSDRGLFLGDYQGLAASRQSFFPLWIATFLPSRIDPPAKQPDAFTRAMRAP